MNGHINVPLGVQALVPLYSIAGIYTGDARSGRVVAVSLMKTAPTEIALILSVDIGGGDVHEYFASQVSILPQPMNQVKICLP